MSRRPDALTPGQQVEVPGLPGLWQVWSKCAHRPGAYYVVRDGACRTILARRPRGATEPKIELLRDVESPHLHSEYVPGCYRCDLSRQEAQA